MQDRQVDWGGVFARMSAGDGRDRDIAEWELARELILNLGDYYPKGMPPRPTELSRVSIDELREHVQSGEGNHVAKAWSAFREGVTWIEAVNAGRLLALGMLARSMGYMLERGGDPAIIGNMSTRLAVFISEQWHVDVPTNGDLRAWSSKATARPDLLPYAWRSL